MSRSSPSRAQVALNFGLVYVLWGSTYLAMRISDETIPPTVMGATRFLTAGVLMLAWCAAARRRVAVTAPQAWRLAVIGILLLSTANVVVAWAELYVPSGLAALIVAVVPLWVMLIEWRFYQERLSARGLLGLALGIAGMIVLLWPQLRSGDALGQRTLVGAALLMGASISWSAGSVLARKWQMGIDALVATGWEMVFAGTVNLLAATALGDLRRTVWAPRSLLAIAYLIVFGSWIGFSAYIWLLNHVPTAKAATYAYVNPVIAVFLGWLVLHEKVDRWVLAGTVVIVAAVALVINAKVRRSPRQPARVAAADLPACEQGAD